MPQLPAMVQALLDLEAYPGTPQGNELSQENREFVYLATLQNYASQ